MKELTARIGTFFYFLGIGSLIIFAASEMAKKPAIGWLAGSLALFIIGWLFRRRVAPPPPSGRFSLVRRARERRKQKQEEKAQKK